MWGPEQGWAAALLETAKAGRGAGFGVGWRVLGVSARGQVPLAGVGVVGEVRAGRLGDSGHLLEAPSVPSCPGAVTRVYFPSLCGVSAACKSFTTKERGAQGGQQLCEVCVGA